MIVLKSTYRDLVYKYEKAKWELYHKDAEISRLKTHITILEQSFLYGAHEGKNDESNKPGL